MNDGESALAAFERMAECLAPERDRLPSSPWVSYATGRGSLLVFSADTMTPWQLSGMCFVTSRCPALHNCTKSFGASFQRDARTSIAAPACANAAGGPTDWSTAHSIA